MAQTTAQIKRGDSFGLTLQVAIAGTVQDLTNWTILSQVRQADGKLVETLVANIVDGPQGKFNVASLGTGQWPVGLLDWDIQYTTDAGQIISTDTIQINVVKDVSR